MRLAEANLIRGENGLKTLFDCLLRVETDSLIIAIFCRQQQLRRLDRRSASARNRRARSMGCFMQYSSLSVGPIEDGAGEVRPVVEFLF